jgi:hypothetical protein
MAKRKAQTTYGFGFDPAQSPHHFLVDGRNDVGDVTIIERFVWDDGNESDADAPEPNAKAILDAYRWARIAPVVTDVFNARLRLAGLPTASFSATPPLAPHLGKELTLLAWAVEDADPTLLPAMLANWVGLAPEERWWLYTTINATSGHPEHGRDRGWRKAIKIAFAENPTSSAPPSVLLTTPQIAGDKRPVQRRAKKAAIDPGMKQMQLF